MAIHLDHTIVPATDNEAAAKWFAHIFGLWYDGPTGHFAPVRVDDSLTLDFDTREQFEYHHYAFKVSDDEFDAIFQRIQDGSIAFGSQPNAQDNLEINHRGGGRGVYFRDPNGHSLELLTR
jgi:catechol 2,3-dioxygenase-like lactoylglutathione lyase family enzyme